MSDYRYTLHLEIDADQWEDLHRISKKLGKSKNTMGRWAIDRAIEHFGKELTDLEEAWRLHKEKYGTGQDLNAEGKVDAKAK